jgi:hypothetical protein
VTPPTVALLESSAEIEAAHPEGEAFHLCSNDVIKGWWETHEVALYRTDADWHYVSPRYSHLKHNQFFAKKRTEKNKAHAAPRNIARSQPAADDPDARLFSFKQAPIDPRLIEEALTAMKPSSARLVAGGWNASASMFELARQPLMIRTKVCWVWSAACRALALHPAFAAQARSVLGAGVPLYVKTTQIIAKDAGAWQPMHTDLDMWAEECRGAGSATVWALVRVGQDPLPRAAITVIEGSQRTNVSFDHWISERDCWTPRTWRLRGQGPLEMAPHCTDEELVRKAQATWPAAGLRYVDGPVHLWDGLVWRGSTWHETHDDASRTAVLIQYGTEACMRALRAPQNFPFDPRIRWRGPDRYPFLAVPELSPAQAASVVRAAAGWRSAGIAGGDVAPFQRAHWWDTYMLPYTEGRQRLFWPDERGAIPPANWHDACAHQLAPVSLRVPRTDATVRTGVLRATLADFSPEGSPDRTLGGIDVHHWKHVQRTPHLALISAQLMRGRRGGAPEIPARAQPTDELCVVLEGKLDYVLGLRGQCGLFSAFVAERGHIGLIPAGLYHARGPSNESDARELCVRFAPRSRDPHFAQSSALERLPALSHNKQWLTAVAAASLAASKLPAQGRALAADGTGAPAGESFETLLWHFENKAGDALGYRQLVGYVVSMGAGARQRVDSSALDVLIVPLHGTTRVRADSAAAGALILTPGEFAVVPVGASGRGIALAANSGPADCLVVKVASA